MIGPDRFAAGMTIQLRRLDEALVAGMPRRGWKVGINVPEVQRSLGLPHAGVGWIDGHKVLDSGARLVRSGDARLRVEPEIAISLAAQVLAGSSAATARSCIAHVCPALEIVDYGRAGSSLDDVVGHCMFHEATVLGSATSLENVDALGEEWPRLRVGDRDAEAPRSDLVPRDPGRLVAFVADYLEAFGRSLEAGDLLLSGSFTAKALEIGPGERASADFGPLGTVEVRIAD